MEKKDASQQITSYTTEAWKKVNDYKSEVESGAKVAGRWIRHAVERSRRDEQRSDIYFNTAAVNRVFEFFYHVYISDGKRYQRFEITPYQAWILSEIFGWYYTAEPEKRRYRYALLFTARKSGKTVFFVAVELYILTYDHQQAPEAYLCATTREQAGQALKYSKEIIAHSPALNKRLKRQQFQILYPRRSGLMKVLANKPEKNDSLNPSIFIMDEMHAHPTLDFFNVMKSGTVFRKNPLGIITSTAGFNKEYPFFQMLRLGERVLQGEVEDDITFYALYTLDSDDEIENFATWEKANPNIGHTISLQDLIFEYRKAKLTPTELNNFITKNLNRYLDNVETWIADDEYQKCFFSLPLPEGRPQAFVGIDLSSTRDLTSFCIVYVDPATSKLVAIPEFHFPNNPERKIRASGIDLGAWIAKGYIFEHQTTKMDQEFIVERLSYWNTVFEIVHINYDKWNSGFIIPKLEQELYIFCQHFQQVTTWFNFPLKYIEREIYSQNIVLSDNPVLRWNYANVVLYYDGNGNIKIMKNKSHDSVDGAVSMAMAVGAWLQYNGDTTAEFFKELMNQRNEQTS